jgi:hypothetical protein
MKPIIMVMLAVQAGIVLVAVYTVLTAKAGGAERRPVWSGLIIALVICAGTSWQIGEKHEGQQGADILMYVSPLLFGMAIMGALFAIRRRRGLDGAPPPA